MPVRMIKKYAIYPSAVYQARLYDALTRDGQITVKSGQPYKEAERHFDKWIVPFGKATKIGRIWNQSGSYDLYLQPQELLMAKSGWGRHIWILKRARGKRNPTSRATRHQIRREDREDAAGVRRLKADRSRFGVMKHARFRRLRKKAYRGR